LSVRSRHFSRLPSSCDHPQDQEEDEKVHHGVEEVLSQTSKVALGFAEEGLQEGQGQGQGLSHGEVSYRLPSTLTIVVAPLDIELMAPFSSCFSPTLLSFAIDPPDTYYFRT
jgi:hypothetical protein